MFSFLARLLPRFLAHNFPNNELHGHNFPADCSFKPIWCKLTAVQHCNAAMMILQRRLKLRIMWQLQNKLSMAGLVMMTTVMTICNVETIYSKIPFITRTVYNANLLITRILVSPLFVIYLIKWSAYSAGLHTARILLIPNSARYKGSTTV